MVILDTPIWSHVLRRDHSHSGAIKLTVTKLIQDKQTILLGPVL